MNVSRGAFALRRCSIGAGAAPARCRADRPVRQPAQRLPERAGRRHGNRCLERHLARNGQAPGGGPARGAAQPGAARPAVQGDGEPARAARRRQQRPAQPVLAQGRAHGRDGRGREPERAGALGRRLQRSVGRRDRRQCADDGGRARVAPATSCSTTRCRSRSARAPRSPARWSRATMPGALAAAEANGRDPADRHPGAGCNRQPAARRGAARPARRAGDGGARSGARGAARRSAAVDAAADDPRAGRQSHARHGRRASTSPSAARRSPSSRRPASEISTCRR